MLSRIAIVVVGIFILGGIALAVLAALGVVHVGPDGVQWVSLVTTDEAKPAPDKPAADKPASTPPPAEVSPAARAELKSQLRNELRAELKTELRAELKNELRAELAAELKAAQPAAVTPPAVATAPPPAVPPAPKPPAVAIRINVACTAPVKDPQGNVWEADNGFPDGQTVDRGPIPIANTAFPDIYRTERYAMNSFNHAVPNGRYKVRLHFAETYEGITSPGQRLFGMNVQGTQFDNFDVFKEAGGQRRALVKEVPVTVTDGAVHITFKFIKNAPEINAIEIISE